MIKISIINKILGIQTHGAHFDTLAEAQEWIQHCKNQSAHGRVGGWYPIEQLKEEEMQFELEREVRDNGIGNYEVWVHIPDMYDVIIDDISEQIAAEKKAKEDFKTKIKGLSKKENFSQNEIKEALQILLTDLEKRS